MSRHQLFFKIFENEDQKAFGGSLLKGNARERRPISTERAMHLVMRSSLATGERSFLRHSKKITNLINRTARAKGVKIYGLANSGNHLHLVVLPSTRKAFIDFARAITGLIPRIVLGVQRGNAQGLKFWDARPFTRILEWGRDLKNVLRYLKQNTLEALGFIPYQPRKGARAKVPSKRVRRFRLARRHQSTGPS